MALSKVTTRQWQAAAKSLSRMGYAVLENAVPVEATRGILKDIHYLRDNNHLINNTTRLVHGDDIRYVSKPNIFEFDSMHPNWRAVAVHTHELTGLFVDRTIPTYTQLFLPHLPSLAVHALKAQVNHGSGGCFPMHCDTDPTLDTRLITAILYLNEHWETAHGGELVLYPYPAPKVTFAPKAGTLVLFSSPFLAHRTLPSNVPRACVTIWISAVSRPTPERDISKLLQGSVEEIIANPEARKLVTTAALSSEWIRSIKEAHLVGESNTEDFLEGHRQDVEYISSLLGPSKLRQIVELGENGESIPMRWL